MKLASLFLLLALFAAVIICGCAASPPADVQNAGAANQSLSDAGNQSFSNISAIGMENPEMKTIGIIGGVSWVSSLEYYRLMNEMAMDRLGGLHSAKILMFSVEFGEISEQERLARQGDWAPLRKSMVDAAQRLERGGADFIIIGSNTMHSTVPDIEANVNIPVLHIADATGAKVNESGIKTVALFGTKYTMEADFYRNILENKYGFTVVTPNETERDYVNAVIFDELCANVIRNESRDGYVRIINRLVEEEGAEGVILGCTEIPLLVKQEDVRVPVFDTTAIHAQAAVDYALGKGNLILAGR